MTESTSEYKKRIEEIKQSIENEPYMAKMREDIAEGISKTGIRQATVEEQFQSVLDETTGKDVISAPEVILARGGAQTLGERLDSEKAEVSAQLQQKANELEVRKKTELIGVNDLDGTTLGYLQDGAGGAVIDIQSIPKSKSVTPGKTDFLQELYPNLINNQAIKEKGAWSITTGEWATRDDMFSIEGYIPVTAGETIFSNAYSFYTYDVDYNYVSTRLTKDFTVDSTYVYIRPNYKYANVSPTTAYIRKEKNIEHFKSEHLIVERENMGIGSVGESQIINDSISTEKVKFLIPGTDMYYKDYDLMTDQVIVENGVYRADGSFASRDDMFTIEGYIPVTVGKPYTSNMYSYNAYTEDYTFIGIYYGNFTTQNELVKYIKPNFKTTTGTDNATFIERRLSQTLKFDSSIAIPESNLDNALQNKINAITPGVNKSKFMHMSCDDVVGLFEDLTTNANTYASIFDNDVLAFLKSLHDSYGMVFSGYCFFMNATFNLAQATSKFANEFTANSDWLKFGFHAISDGTDYSTADYTKGKTDYESMMTELLRILGSWECIDRVPRTHYYAGPIAVAQAFRDTPLSSVLGFLSAEDDRTSYYHTAEQRDFLRTHDRLYDPNERLHFFSTDIRLESTPDVTTELNKIVTNATYSSRAHDLIIFMHEGRLSETHTRNQMIECCEFAVANEYRFDFPMNVIQ